jgi:hypothetical protein
MNKAPFFVSEIKDIQMKISEKNQIDGLVSLFILKSPKVMDEEGNSISIHASGY